MAQRRFNRRLVGGLVVGYVGMLFILASILTHSWWFIFGKVIKNDTVVYGGKVEGLFLDNSSAAIVCQVFACLSFTMNAIACVLGMLASYAVTRPSIAVKRLKIRPRRLSFGPKVAGCLYAASGLLIMTSASVATEHFQTGYSVLLAWISFVLCIIAGLLLVIALPPNIPDISESESSGWVKGLSEAEVPRETGKQTQDMNEETLPRAVATADTLQFEETPNQKYAAAEKEERKLLSQI